MCDSRADKGFFHLASCGLDLPEKGFFLLQKRALGTFTFDAVSSMSLANRFYPQDTNKVVPSTISLIQRLLPSFFGADSGRNRAAKLSPIWRS